MQNAHNQNKIIFFDGLCILCNRSVDFLLSKDHKMQFKFASLQSDYAKTFPDQALKKITIDSVIFYDEGKVFIKSSAVLKIASYLGYPYFVISAFRIIPVSIRDCIYDYIARNRSRWFGRRDSCRLPDEGSKDRFLG
jgi:predicted DCC family thiol-disulfide oxidoreductase YuxK